MPKDFKLDGYEDIKPFSYVRVDASSVEIKGKDYKYPQKVLDEYVPIMTVDWEQYKEEQSVSDLKDEGDFLLYFEQIVLKEKQQAGHYFPWQQRLRTQVQRQGRFACCQGEVGQTEFDEGQYKSEKA